MSNNPVQTDVSQMFLAAEQNGLKLAIKGRLAAVLLVGLMMALSRGPERAPEFILAMLVFAIPGVIHYRIIGSKYDRWWVKYAFMTFDVLLLSIAVAFVPPTSEAALPQNMMFRFTIFPFYFILLGIAAFSFSPGLVLWTGIVGALSWTGAFFFVFLQMEAPLTWSNMPDNPTTEQFLDVFLDPRFTPPGTAGQEAMVFLVVAMLIAIVMRRARNTVRRQLEAERDSTAISQLFGRFVPPAVANSMIENRGTLDPTERAATVLFSDLVDFTKLTEAKGARDMITTLNEFFDEAAEVIGKHNGVVTQFQGDGILATFNVPLEDEEHAQNAFDAANSLVDLVRSKSFGGENLQIRVGLSTGPLIAGNVGGGGRQSYTVYGDPVNLAARLEGLNKVHGTNILISQSTADLLKEADLEQIGNVDIRGLSVPVGIFASRAAE